MARHTKERAEQTREAILDAAVQVFFDRGVTRGAIYWHFRDKLDLFSAIDERLRLPKEEELLHLARSAPTEPLAALQTVIVGIMRGFCADKAIQMQATVLLFRCDYVDDMAPALERQAAFQRRLSEVFARYFREVVPPPGAGCDWTPDMAAQGIHTMVCGVMLRALRFPAEFPMETDGIAILEAFFAALRNGWDRAS